MGYSLWLIPSAPEAARLKYVMSIRSPSTISSSSFATFAPHITLASVAASTPSSLLAAIPAGLRAVPVRFASVDVGAKYFMSVYATVHETPALAMLRKRLRAALGERSVPPLPHLSLYYIDEADSDARARVSEILHTTGRVVKRAVGVTLNCVPTSAKEPLPAGQNNPSLQLLEGFEGAEIWVVKCEGHPHDWQVLHKLTLPH